MTEPDPHCAQCGKLKPVLTHGRLSLRLEVAEDDYCSSDCCKLAHGIELASKAEVTK